MHAPDGVVCLGLAKIDCRGEIDSLVEEVGQVHDVLYIANKTNNRVNIAELTIVPSASAMEAPQPLRLRIESMRVPDNVPLVLPGALTHRYSSGTRDSSRRAPRHIFYMTISFFHSRPLLTRTCMLYNYH